MSQPNERILIKQYISPGMDADILDKNRYTGLHRYLFRLPILQAGSFKHLRSQRRVIWYPAVVVVENDMPRFQLFGCMNCLLKHLICPLTDL